MPNTCQQVPSRTWEGLVLKTPMTAPACYRTPGPLRDPWETVTPAEDCSPVTRKFPDPTSQAPPVPMATRRAP